MSGPFRGTREVIVRTEDWERALSFYGSVLGLPVAYRGETILGFETGAVRLYVEKGRPHDPVFEFLVADVETAKRALLAAGCVIQEEDPALPRCYVRDPFGFVFNVGRARARRLPPPDLSKRPFTVAAQRLMAASPSALYHAWTDQLDRWFAAPGTLLFNPVVDSPVFWQTEHEGQRHPHYGRILRLEPDRLVELTWLSSGTKGAETIVTVALTPAASGTHLELTHAGFLDQESRDRHDHAWPRVLAHLDATIGASAE